MFVYLKGWQQKCESHSQEVDNDDKGTIKEKIMVVLDGTWRILPVTKLQEVPYRYFLVRGPLNNWLRSVCRIHMGWVFL